jgi:hypothetical protein
MTFSIIIATHGEDRWAKLAQERALPSALIQDAHEVLVGHDYEGTRADVRNALSEKATGEWLITLDADDELDEGYVTAMTGAAQPRSLLTPRVSHVKKGTGGVARFMPEVDLEKGNWMVVGTAVPRDLFLEVGGWRTFTGTGVLNQWDDWDLWIRCVQAGAEIVRVDDAVYVAHVGVSPHYQRTREQTNAWLREIRQANGIGGRDAIRNTR